jgi:hypothetical protein
MIHMIFDSTYKLPLKCPRRVRWYKWDRRLRINLSPPPLRRLSPPCSVSCVQGDARDGRKGHEATGVGWIARLRLLRCHLGWISGPNEISTGLVPRPCPSMIVCETGLQSLPACAALGPAARRNTTRCTKPSPSTKQSKSNQTKQTKQNKTNQTKPKPKPKPNQTKQNKQIKSKQTKPNQNQNQNQNQTKTNKTNKSNQNKTKPIQTNPKPNKTKQYNTTQRKTSTRCCG